MRLVACASCAAQYDASGVDAEAFECVCGERVDAKPLVGREATVARCGSCGASVAADAEACSYCSSTIERGADALSLICPACYGRSAENARFCTACGLGFHPQEIPVEGLELPCPSCGVLMPPRSLAGVVLNECPNCNGLWVPEERFETLVRRAVDAREAHPERVASFQPRTRGANPATQSVKYRKCPVCEAFMVRRNYRKTSGVILDRCTEHGTWLDADELEAIAGFILVGGRPQADAFMAHTEAQAEATYREARRQNIAAGFGGAATRTVETSSLTGSALRSLFSSLLD